MHGFVVTTVQGTEFQFFIYNEEHAMKVKKQFIEAVKRYNTEDRETMLHVESDDGEYIVHASQLVTFQCYRPADAQKAHDDATMESELASMETSGGMN